jgi:hypothetical protein
MHQRIKRCGRGRLKRENFVTLAKGEISEQEVSLTAKKKPHSTIEKYRTPRTDI